MIARRFICFLFNLATPLLVFAANPVTWNVNISTTGEDVFWTSPTAITTGLPEYDYSYEITKLTANVALFGNRDLLGLLDETSGSGTAGVVSIRAWSTKRWTNLPAVHRLIFALKSIRPEWDTPRAQTSSSVPFSASRYGAWI